MDSLLLLGPATFALSVWLIYRFRNPARTLGLVDAPGGRKAHKEHIPVVGGVGMFVAFMFMLLFIEGSLYPYRGLLLGMGLLLVTGVLDDLHDLGPLEKITLQAIAAGLLIWWGGLVIRDFGVLPLVGRFEFGVLSIPVTLVCVVGVSNAANMIDGADGLCGGVMLSVLFWLAMIALSAEDHVALMLPALLACAVAGFLVFNFPWHRRRSATVFMGDSGSTMLGFAAAWFAIDLAFEQRTGVPPVAVAWILALPVFDTLTLMLRRMLKGKSPLVADRDHLHHIFERAGFSPTGTAWMFTVTAFAFGAVGVGSWWLGVSEVWLWPPLLGLLLVHFLFVYRAWRATRLLRSATVWLRRGPLAASRRS